MTFTTIPTDPYLDFTAGRGQRVERYTFQWINGVTNAPLGYVKPDREQPPQLTHSTEQAIKRQLTLKLNEADTAAIDPLTDRILPFMTVGGTTYPIGRYMFTTETDLVSTGGERGEFTLLDEGFIIDQEIENSFTHSGSANGAVAKLLTGLPLVGIEVDATPYGAVGGYGSGSTRGQILAALATQGDYFPYWMNNAGVFKMIRTVDPGNAVVDFDFDASNKIRRDSVEKTSDVLTAPNRFVVVSNQGSSAPVVGRYDVPPSAPHSIANRGFVIQQTDNLQLTDVAQAAAVARNIGIRQTVFERITLTTANDPRHDGYNVILFAGSQWLELGWTMTLAPGGEMQHTMRRAYA